MPKPAATPVPPPPVAAIPAPPDVKPPANAIAVTPPSAMPTSPPAATIAPPPVAAAPAPKPAEIKPVETPKVAAAPKPAETKPVEPPKVTAAAKPTTDPKQLAAISPSAAGFRIQIASLRTTEDATKSWEKLKTANPDLLGKLAGNVVKADLGDKGTFYRVIAGPLVDRDAADTLCNKLKQRNVGCLIVRP
jgi:cell division septation protein DedD